jgi:hypothetical protein
MTELLWNHISSFDDLKLYNKLITESIHRVNDKRTKHLAAWIGNSTDPKSSLEFIKNNINCSKFHPFANPWDFQEINNIFNMTGGTKLIRLSTRCPGELTLSNTYGINASKRFNVRADGIIFGNFKFKTVVELMFHMTNNECCICLDFIIDKESNVLVCGHIFHTICLSKSGNHTNKCPFCRTFINEDFNLPKGDSCMYMSIDSIDINDLKISD